MPTIDLKNLEDSTNRLLGWVEAERFMGYDPYDTLTSPVLNKLPVILQFIALQLQKRNPINIRRYLGIKKGFVHKGMALFLSAYSKLAEQDINHTDIAKDSKYLNQCHYLYQWLLNNHTNGFKGLCWSIHFPVAKINSLRPKNDPSSVLACFVGNSFYEYYRVSKRDEIIDSMIQIADFLFHHIPVTDFQSGHCFSYTTRKRDIVINANALVGEYLSRLYSLTNDRRYLDTAKKCIEFTLSKQKGDGSWVYSIDKSGNEKIQNDFHQGFIINSLIEYHNSIGCTDEKLLETINKGIRYYKEKLFTPEGTSYWRCPKKLPVDIHNQAQGILTFLAATELDKEYLFDAIKIANWTISNMQSIRGYFYYQKWPLFTNKIPFIRWGQAWMLLALASLKTALANPFAKI